MGAPSSTGSPGIPTASSCRPFSLIAPICQGLFSVFRSTSASGDLFFSPFAFAAPLPFPLARRHTGTWRWSVLNMVTCDRCSKIFGSPGPRICPACIKALDKVYERAREYLRDNPNERLNVHDLAEALGEEPSDIDLLVSTGRIRLWGDDSSSDSDNNRARLLKDFEKNLAKGSSQGGSVFHTADRYRKKP